MVMVPGGEDSFWGESASSLTWRHQGRFMNIVFVVRMYIWPGAEWKGLDRVLATPSTLLAHHA
jgi:hypothetical protein